jgi:hypothetical protein
MSSDPSGIVITNDHGKYIVTPAGNLDLKELTSELDNPAPISIKRSMSILLALSETGRMFVSPSGEVDLSSLKTPLVRSDSIGAIKPIRFEYLPITVISTKAHERLVVFNDGKIQKMVPEVQKFSPPPLRRANSALISPNGVVVTPSGKEEFSVHFDQNCDRKEQRFSFGDSIKLVVNYEIIEDLSYKRNHEIKKCPT